MLFWRKNIGAQAACNMLVKLTLGVSNDNSKVFSAVKMRQKNHPEIREQYPREKAIGADDDRDPVVKLREKVKLIQDRVGKVLEQIVVPDTPTVAKVQKETKRNSEFDMDAWRREREKIRY